MSESKSELLKFLHMKHGEVRRTGQPKLQNATPESIDLVVTVMPSPSFIWNEVFLQAAEGTVMEGRVSISGDQIKLQTMDEELENDMRRLDQLLKTANEAFNRRFSDARKKIEQLDKQSVKTEAERRKELEERLRKFQA